MRTAPEDCRSMAELRAAIDRVDREIVAALALRARYIDRATELKPAERLPARIEMRVEEVVANVRRAAEAQDLDPGLVEAIWRHVIEWSIVREEAVLGPGDEA